MSACAACGAAPRPGARFCGQCGAATAGEVLDAPACPTCGRVSRGGRFCGGCGASLDAPQTATARPAAAGPVLYVAPAALRGALEGALLTALAGPNRGRVLWVARDDALSATQAALRDPSASPDAVCLVGDAEALPHARLPDPCGYDEALWTDALYGMRSTPTAEARLAGDVLPDLPVARLPTRDPALIRRLLRVGATLSPGWASAAAVSAAVWASASSAVLDAAGAATPCVLAPPSDRPAVRAALTAAPARLYFNVHGTDQDAVWLGEGDGRYPEVLRPADLAPHAPTGARVAPDAVVFSEACYGATLQDGPGSLAHAFLAAGASCFAGSTVIAWGAGPGHPPALADELALGFFRHLDAGLPAARALHQAKADLADAALSGGGGLSAPLHNTLLSFALYGAPLASVSAPAPRAAPPLAPLADARARLQRRLRPADWRLLTSGRLDLAALQAHLAHAPGVSARLAALLGAPPADARVLRYGAGPAARATVLASAAGPVPRRVALELDAAGHLLRALVSR